MNVRRLISPMVGIVLGAGYGLFARWFFEAGSKTGWDKVFGGVTIAFLFLVPFALGVLTAALAPPGLRDPWAYWILAPCASAALLLASAVALLLEGSICIVMAAPVVLVLAMAGGLCVGLVTRLRKGRGVPPSAVASCLVLPFVFAPAESRLPNPEEIRTVTTAIDIAAPPAAVWRQVVRVPRIREDEQAVGFFQRIGIPRPLEATLSHDGVGGLREARFAGGIRFHERVTEWQPARRLGFTIEVDSASVSSAVLDAHVRVGGDHFDVVYGAFELESRGPGTRLHLLSRHRLRTRFNRYAGLWTDAVMQDIQQNICRVLRARSEGATRR
jgi:hypothetical protein